MSRHRASLEIRLERHDPMLRRLDLAYALNAHHAQGATADRAILVARASEGRLITATSLAVLFTRAREAVHLVTDDLDRLTGRAARQSGEKSSAVEVALAVAPEVRVEIRKPQRPRPAQPSRTPDVSRDAPEATPAREPPQRERFLELGL